MKVLSYMFSLFCLYLVVQGWSVLWSIQWSQYFTKLASCDACTNINKISSVVETPWIPLRPLLIRVFGVFGWKGSTEFGLRRLCLEGGGEVVLILLLLLHCDMH